MTFSARFRCSIIDSIYTSLSKYCYFARDEKRYLINIAILLFAVDSEWGDLDIKALAFDNDEATFLIGNQITTRANENICIIKPSNKAIRKGEVL